MKIGTLLTAAVVSLSAAGGALSVYVAATKYQTMDKVAVAQRRLGIVRAVGDIPRYLNPERGFATNLLLGAPVIEPKLRAGLDNYRKQTDGARDKMIEIRKTLPGDLADGAAIGSAIDALDAKFTDLRATMARALDGPAEARRDAAKKIVADNAVFNSAVTSLLDDQVRKIASLDGDAFRQANYANIAWTLRDVSAWPPTPRNSNSAAPRAAATRSCPRCRNCAAIRRRRPMWRRRSAT
jgi:methyl-accepting chemotaxis protein